MVLAVVTGGGSGIGRSLAVTLAASGVNVFIVGRTVSKLQAVRALNPDRIDIIVADVGSRPGRKNIKQVLSASPVDYLVHNAAVATPMKTLDKVTEEEWRSSFAINVEGPLFLTQALLPQLASGSRVLHISSGIAHFTYPGVVPYSCTKAALHMLYQGWSQELMDRGIAVGSVQPGLVDTDMQVALRACDDDDFPARQVFKDFKKNNQLLSADEVARSISWMLEKMPSADFSEKDWLVEDITQRKDADALM